MEFFFIFIGYENYSYILFHFFYPFPFRISLHICYSPNKFSLSLPLPPFLQSHASPEFDCHLLIVLLDGFDEFVAGGVPLHEDHDQQAHDFYHDGEEAGEEGRYDREVEFLLDRRGVEHEQEEQLVENLERESLFLVDAFRRPVPDVDLSEAQQEVEEGEEPAELVLVLAPALLRDVLVD